VDRLSSLRRAPRRVHRRLRPRHAVAAAIALWALAGLLPLAGSLPVAIGTGSVARRLHGELSVLDSGWYGPQFGGAGASAFAWVWSDGPTSTMAIEPGWREVSLELRAVTCPGGRLQHIVFSSPATRRTHLVRVRADWLWYRVPLGWAGDTRELVLRYRCVVVPASVHSGDPDTRSLAVAIARLVPNAT
jgi:hypothetical protein